MNPSTSQIRQQRRSSSSSSSAPMHSFIEENSHEVFEEALQQHDESLILNNAGNDNSNEEDEEELEVEIVNIGDEAEEEEIIFEEGDEEEEEEEIIEEVDDDESDDQEILVEEEVVEEGEEDGEEDGETLNGIAANQTPIEPLQNSVTKTNGMEPNSSMPVTDQGLNARDSVTPSSKARPDPYQFNARSRNDESFIIDGDDLESSENLIGDVPRDEDLVLEEDESQRVSNESLKDKATPSQSVKVRPRSATPGRGNSPAANQQHHRHLQQPELEQGPQPPQKQQEQPPQQLGGNVRNKVLGTLVSNIEAASKDDGKSSAMEGEIQLSARNNLNWVEPVKVDIPMQPMEGSDSTIGQEALKWKGQFFHEKNMNLYVVNGDENVDASQSIDESVQITFFPSPEQNPIIHNETSSTEEMPPENTVDLDSPDEPDIETGAVPVDHITADQISVNNKEGEIERRRCYLLLLTLFLLFAAGLIIVWFQWPISDNRSSTPITPNINDTEVATPTGAPPATITPSMDLSLSPSEWRRTIPPSLNPEPSALYAYQLEKGLWVGNELNGFGSPIGYGDGILVMGIAPKGQVLVASPEDLEVLEGITSSSPAVTMAATTGTIAPTILDGESSYPRAMFGTSVALTGDYLVIGAPFLTGAAAATGSTPSAMAQQLRPGGVMVYRRTTTSISPMTASGLNEETMDQWTPYGGEGTNHILRGTEDFYAVSGEFGSTVVATTVMEEIASTGIPPPHLVRVVVGAPRTSLGLIGTNAFMYRLETGRVYTFDGYSPEIAGEREEAITRSGDTNSTAPYWRRWDTSSDPGSSPLLPLVGDRAGDHFGAALALSRDGSFLLVGAPGSDIHRDPGYVHGYRWVGAPAHFNENDTGHDGTLITTTNTTTTVGTVPAASGPWDLVFVGRGTEREERFGTSVVLLTDSGDTFAVGAPSFSEGRGRIVIFQQTGLGLYRQLGSILTGNEPGDRIGATLSGSVTTGTGSLSYSIVSGTATGMVRRWDWNAFVQQWEELYEPLDTGFPNGVSSLALMGDDDHPASRIAVGSVTQQGMSMFVSTSTIIDRRRTEQEDPSWSQ